MIYVFGHTNPDTDAFCSAVAYAEFLEKTGKKATPIALGEPNNETKKVFERAGVSLPEVRTILPGGSDIALVDHNEAGQSIPSRDDYRIVSVVDHHKVADFSTSGPVHMKLETVGCTCTIIWMMFQEKGLLPSHEVALLMLSAIISDTLYFRSPTTTDFDKNASHELATIAQIEDTEAWSLEMFAAKSDLGDMLADAIVTADYKEYTFGETKIGFGVMETTDPGYAKKRKSEILEAMGDVQSKQGLSNILFCVIDILNEQNICFVNDESVDLVKHSFGVDVIDNEANLGSRVSRKKQIVPEVQSYIENL